MPQCSRAGSVDRSVDAARKSACPTELASERAAPQSSRAATKKTGSRPAAEDRMTSVPQAASLPPTTRSSPAAKIRLECNTNKRKPEWRFPVCVWNNSGSLHTKLKQASAGAGLSCASTRRCLPSPDLAWASVCVYNIWFLTGCGSFQRVRYLAGREVWKVGRG